MNSHRPYTFLVPAVLLASVAACNNRDNTGISPVDTPASAASSVGMSDPTSPVLVGMDRSFMATAAGGGLYEVEVSKLASERATNPQVKAFASMLVVHHTAANEQLKSLAMARGVTLPDATPTDKRSIIDSLAALSGDAFDRRFVQVVGIEDHEADIKLFETSGMDTSDPELKAWVSKTLPTLREHLASARQLPMAAVASAAPT